MKKLTLDQTWDACIAFWGKVIREHKKGVRCISDIKDDFAPPTPLLHNCYFCEYAKQRTGHRVAPQICFKCPGVIATNFKVNIDAMFWWCEQEGKDYIDDPIAFYAELVRLNKIRLAKKGKNVAK